MKELSVENELAIKNTAPPDDTYQPAKDLIASFVVALKNYSLYPEDHEISRRTVDIVATRLNGFLQKYGAFKFHVKGGQILFHDQVVHEGPHDVGNLAFILFRDGIRWVEFNKGIQIEEIRGFLSLVNQNRDTFEESEGDLVTSLWEVRFSHILYEASDLVLRGETVTDFFDLRVKEPEQGIMDQEEEEATPDKSFVMPKATKTIWTLSADEILKLREMVLAHENRPVTEELLDVMMAVLRDNIDENDLQDTFGFLREEFRGLLSRMEFQIGIALLRGIHKIYVVCKTDKPLAIPQLNSFIKEISDKDVLNTLENMWPALEALDAKRRLLWQLLNILPPEVILAIGPMSLKISSRHVQTELLTFVKSQAGRSIVPFEKLLKSADKAIVEKLVPVLQDLEGERPSEILLKLTRNSSERIRKRALDTLIARDSRLLKEVFSLIEDPSEPIRLGMFRYLGRNRNEFAEDLLLDYLAKKQYERNDENHLLACYGALGRCGSARSIPFLSKVLFRSGWLPGFERSRHRLGAAIALKKLGFDEAKDLLNKSSKSLNFFVRAAHRKAMEINRWP